MTESFAAVARLTVTMAHGSSLFVTRKIFVFVIVLIISGVAPATAVLGFCAKMPCCFNEPNEGPVIGADTAHCCSTISCYEAPSNELTVSAKAKSIVSPALAVMPFTTTIPNIHEVGRAFDDGSPPRTTQQRLSSLSTFLI